MPDTQWTNKPIPATTFPTGFTQFKQSTDRVTPSTPYRACRVRNQTQFGNSMIVLRSTAINYNQIEPALLQTKHHITARFRTAAVIWARNSRCNLAFPQLGRTQLRPLRHVHNCLQNKLPIREEAMLNFLQLRWDGKSPPSMESLTGKWASRTSSDAMVRTPSTCGFFHSHDPVEETKSFGIDPLARATSVEGAKAHR